jgi:predicted acetyltransferase
MEAEPMISLSPASQQDHATLANLMQLYMYDWSEVRPLDVGEDGRFEDYPLDVYWQDQWRHPFLLRADGKLAGFALVAGRSRLTGSEGVFDIAEFFVMRRYRRQGIGLAAACAAFDRFRGSWEVRQREDNLEATAFWRKVVARYTDGKYQEVHWSDSTWTGPVQMFSNPPR